MNEEIINHLNDPKALEKMYRKNKVLFKREFNLLPATVFKEHDLANFWNERLNYQEQKIGEGKSRELMFVITVALMAGIIAKLPALFKIEQVFFYQRNIGFIIFPLLSAYFAWKNKLSNGKIAIIFGLNLIGVIFINLFPEIKKSDTLVLSCIHVVLFLWSILGFAFIGGDQQNETKRLDFLKYNGDLIVITALILLAGGIMSGITIGLFSLLNLNIEDFYFKYIAVFGLAAAPFVGTYLTQTNPDLVGKVSPVIAKIFSPLVLVMLVIYLIAIVYSGKDPYNDRDFLLLFNALLIGVMAIIFFSVAETSEKNRSQMGSWILFLLSATTIIVNGIALSAIVFRIAEWGITPNRAAVLGGNILILIHLILVTVQLFKVVSKKTDANEVGKSIAFYLPIYCIWTIIVTFIFPLLFGFK
jgi:hypothetical protein